MSKEIIVNKGKQTRIAIVENGELAELFIENQEHERTIGNIFLGRIRRVMPSIQAAFVDIGQKQDAFLHFSDLIDNVESWMEYVQEDHPVIGKFKGEYTTKPAGKKRRRPRDQRRGGKGGDHQHVADKDRKDRRKSARGRQHGSHSAKGRGGDSDEPKFDPAKILNRDQPILVKISKEPIANKGSRITTDISLAGRFLVLVPMANYVAVSKKIMSFKERRRLRALARSLLPEGFGVIVRTVAEGRSAKALDTDLNLLIDKWKKIESKLQSNPKPPAVIHEDVNMVSSIMRDLFTEDYDRILIDDQKLYRNIRGYVQAIAPDMVDAVKLESDADSVFKKVGIKDSVEEAFEDRVNLPSGGYLFIEQTEAMHVVDVNSGRAGRGMSQEDSSLKVNLEAAKIICKQIRLRDLGGIIVVDFIDMRHESNKRKLYEMLKKEFRADRAVTKVLPMSDFGLVQITRQRLRPSITKTFSLPEDQNQKEPGREQRSRKQVADRPVEPSHLRVEPEDLLHKIEDWLGEYREAGQSARVRLKVHPFTASFLSGKFPSRTFRWRLRYGVKVQIDADPSVDPMSFRFFDGASGKEISRLPARKDRNARRKPTSASSPPAKEAASADSGSKAADDSRKGGRSSNRNEGGESNEKRSDDDRSRGSRSSRGRSSDSRRSSSSRSDNRRSDSRKEDESSEARSDSRSGSRSGSRGRGRSRSSDSDSSRSRDEGRGRDNRQDSGRNSDNEGRNDRQGGGRSDSRSNRNDQDRGGNRGRGRSENRDDSRENNRDENQGVADRRQGSRDDSRNEGRDGGRQDSRDRGGRDGSDENRDRRSAGRDDRGGQRASDEQENRSSAERTERQEAATAPAKPRSEKPRDEKPDDQRTPDADAGKESPKATDAGKDSSKEEGGKQSPSQTSDKASASEEAPTSNRFVKIDLTSGGS